MPRRIRRLLSQREQRCVQDSSAICFAVRCAASERRHWRCRRWNAERSCAVARWTIACVNPSFVVCRESEKEGSSNAPGLTMATTQAICHSGAFACPDTQLVLARLEARSSWLVGCLCLRTRAARITPSHQGDLPRAAAKPI